MDRQATERPGSAGAADRSPTRVLGDRPSAESRRLVEDLWRRTPSATLTLEEWRFAAGAAARHPRPSWLRTEPVDAGGVPAEWSWRDPDGRPDGPVLLVLHGGGYIVCGIGTHRVLGARLSAAVGGRSLVVGYRLAPEHPFPAAVEDAATAYRWLLDQGVDPGRIVLFGDSAGGNLCLGTTFLARDRGLPMPAAMVLASPGIDLTFAGGSHEANAGRDPFSRIDAPERVIEWYLAGADPRDPLASPAFGDFAGLPPVLVLVGPDEMLLDDARTTVHRARSAGVEAELVEVVGAFHTWLGHAGSLPEADASVACLAEFIQRKSPGPWAFTGRR